MRRFVPWNEEQFELLGEEHISGYLDFYEENMMKKGCAIGSVHPFPEFSKLLDEECSKQKRRREEARHENKPPYEHRGDQLHDEDGAKQPTIVPDFSPYITYTDKKSHTKANPYTEKVTLTPDPFHSCYAQLVEYVAYRSHVAPEKIHSIVANLDEEVMALCVKGKRFWDKDREKERKKRRRRRRVARQKHRVEPETPMSFEQSLWQAAKSAHSGTEEDGFEPPTT